MSVVTDSSEIAISRMRANVTLSTAWFLFIFPTIFYHFLFLNLMIYVLSSTKNYSLLTFILYHVRILKLTILNEIKFDLKFDYILKLTLKVNTEIIFNNCENKKSYSLTLRIKA